MDGNNNDAVIDMGDDDAMAWPGRPPHNRPRTRLPRTSDARLASAEQRSEKSGASGTTGTTGTVLYLAYGSNMASSTFQGARAIRPVSAVPVSAPTLRLTFDLPGLPYREPCFANTAIRRLPRVPKKPDVPDIPDIPDIPGTPDVPVPQPPSTGPIRPPFRRDTAATAASRRPVWSGPLYGVVYEVTAQDYARIIATEGGGASYKEVVVPCFALQPRMGVPERPIRPPTPFLARTLWAPQLPSDDGDETSEDGKGEDGDDDGGDDDDDPTWKDVLKKKWDDAVAAVVKFSAGRMRPDPEYAQPSARYLGLLTTGAAEHELPDAYQAWLASLAPYEATHWRQRLGALLLLLGVVVVGLPLLVVVLASRFFKRDSGRLPVWAQVGLGAAMHSLWVVYDHVLRPICGDGEHTEEASDDSSGERRPLNNMTR